MRATRVKDGGWWRHLEGWQGGVVALSLAALGLVMGVPRPVTPPDFPLPIPDGRRLAEIARQDQAQAAELAQTPEAERSGTAFELRQLGQLLRRYSEADAAGESNTLAELRPLLLRGAFNLVQSSGARPLLLLRAYQQQIFLRELASWEASGKESDELKQVGGGITRTLTSSGWVQPPRSILPDVPTRAALFKRRFAEILGLQSKPEFALALDESRSFYAFLLAHPPNPREGAWAFRLRKLDELAVVDPSYPRKLARGMALLRLGQGALAVVELREHLAQYPDGPHTLRARNFLAAAVEVAERQGGVLP